MGSTAVFTDDSDRMRIVNHHHRLVAVGEITDRTQVGEHAVHREHAVGGNEPIAGIAALLQALLELIHVVVVVTQTPGPAQPDAIDDRGVIQRVGDHGILLVEDGLEEATVGIEA